MPRFHHTPRGPVPFTQADEDEFDAMEAAHARTLALQEIEAEYNARRTSPMSWDFGSTAALDDLGNAVGEAGSQTLQMREAPRDDMKNWLAAQAGAAAAIGAGAPNTIMPIKTTANVWVQTTALQVMQVLVAGDGVQLSALQRGIAQLARFGALKAQLAAAEDAEDLAAVRAAIATGWPA